MNGFIKINLRFFPLFRKECFYFLRPFDFVVSSDFPDELATSSKSDSPLTLGLGSDFALVFLGAGLLFVSISEVLVTTPSSVSICVVLTGFAIVFLDFSLTGSGS